MKYIGQQADGNNILLPAPAESWYDSDEDAPADGFRGVFPLKEDCGMLTGLRIEDNAGSLRFLGTVDAQREIVSGGKTVLRLSCRSLAGPLLDSEPEPQTYEYPNLASIFARHIRPYGFTSFLGNTQVFRGPLSITKGMSEWQAAALFCKCYLQTVPRVRGTVFDATGSSGGKPILFDNAAGSRYCRAEVRHRRCERFFEIYTATAEGGYALAAKDAESEAFGICRKRCLTGPSTSAAELLKKADRKAFAVLADCPGEPETEVGAAAELRDPVLGSFTGLSVAEITCTRGSGGVWTRYQMRRNEPCGFQSRSSKRRSSVPRRTACV